MCRKMGGILKFGHWSTICLQYLDKFADWKQNNKTKKITKRLQKKNKGDKHWEPEMRTS